MYRADFAEYNGKIPFLEFLRSLSDDEQAEILAAIDKLLELKNSNNRISEKLSKYLHDGFFELRVILSCIHRYHTKIIVKIILLIVK